MPIASNWGTPEAFPLSTMKHSQFCTWLWVIDKTQVTQANSFAIANSEKNSRCFSQLVGLHIFAQAISGFLNFAPHLNGNILNFFAIKNNTIGGTSLVVQWLRICLPMQGMWVWPLVGELRSHMPHCTAKKKNNTAIFKINKQLQIKATM